MSIDLNLQVAGIKDDYKYGFHDSEENYAFKSGKGLTREIVCQISEMKNEPAWMRLSALVGAPAGAGVIRDTRAWHGATPNVSREIRAMPNVEYGAPWLDDAMFKPSMPHEIWETLSPHAQAISARIKTAPGEWPAGAGAMHPLASERAKAKAAGAA